MMLFMRLSDAAERSVAAVLRRQARDVVDAAGYRRQQRQLGAGDGGRGARALRAEGRVAGALHRDLLGDRGDAERELEIGRGPEVDLHGVLGLRPEARELGGHLVGAADAHAEDGEPAVPLRDGLVGRSRRFVNRRHGRPRHDRALRVGDDAPHRPGRHTLSGGTSGRHTHDERHAQRTSHPSCNLHFSLSFRKGFRTEEILSRCVRRGCVDCSGSGHSRRRQTSCPAPAEWRPFAGAVASRPGSPCRGAGAPRRRREWRAIPSGIPAGDRHPGDRTTAATRAGRADSSVWTARSCGGTRRWTPP